LTTTDTAKSWLTTVNAAGTVEGGNPLTATGGDEKRGKEPSCRRKLVSRTAMKKPPGFLDSSFRGRVGEFFMALFFVVFRAFSIQAMTVSFPRHSKGRGNPVCHCLRRFRRRRHSRASENPARTLRRAAPHLSNWQPFGLKVTNWIPAFAGMTGVCRHWITDYAGMTEMRGRWIHACAKMTERRGHWIHARAGTTGICGRLIQERSNGFPAAVLETGKQRHDGFFLRLSPYPPCSRFSVLAGFTPARSAASQASFLREMSRQRRDGRRWAVGFPNAAGENRRRDSFRLALTREPPPSRGRLILAGVYARNFRFHGNDGDFLSLFALCRVRRD
jgi:hypothetical protein